MTLIIAGTGRAGTSLLVKLLDGCGLRSEEASGWSEAAQAGLESRFTGDGDDVVKSPWLFEYAPDLGPEAYRSIRRLIVPVRNRGSAVASRMVQERAALIESSPDDDRWRWRTTDRAVPGGIVVGGSHRDVSATLGEGLWDLVEWATERDVPLQFIHYPRFALDFDYFWAQLGDVIGERATRAEAEAVWRTMVDPDSERLAPEIIDPYAHLTKLELVGLIDRLRVTLGRERAVANDVRTDLDSALATHAALQQEANACEATWSAKSAEQSRMLEEADARLQAIAARRSVRVALRIARAARTLVRRQRMLLRWSRS